eukprot:scaffold129468_cov57-Attheya_sp.AAC.1
MVILKDEQTSGAHVDSIASPNEQIADFFTGASLEKYILALKSRFKWKEDTDVDVDGIANSKVCHEGNSLNFVNDPLAYLVTSKLGVDITDNESFSVTCCFHFDD